MLWKVRPFLHANHKHEAKFNFRAAVPGSKSVPAFPREATERRAPHGDAVMSGAKVDGPEFWGLTRLNLAPGGSLLTFNMERSGKPGPFLAVLKVGSLTPSLPVNQNCVCGSLLS